MKEVNTFGSRLRCARKENRMTQRELADQVGAKHNSVSDWENDKNMPDPDTIVLLCEVLNLRPDYLLSKGVSTISGDKIMPNLQNFATNAVKSLSPRAMEIAKAYDAMSDYSKAIIDCVIAQEEKRRADSFGKTSSCAPL